MKIMIIGNGGREDALALSLSQDHMVSGIVCCPGNAGIARRFTCIDPPTKDVDGYLAVALAEKVAFTVVGPEAPLVDGIVDKFTAARMPICGPTKKAAMITEGSKIACKGLLHQAGVPTAGFFVPDDAEAAFRYIHDRKGRGQLVIKADGLCGGKGVRVCESDATAEAAVEDIMVKKIFGTAGAQVVMEKRLYGRECSFIVVTDGTNVIPLVQAQDYKRQKDHDCGGMTGGMGSFAPSPLTKDMVEIIMSNIVYPTLQALREQKITYRGAMYFGLMLTNKGPKVLEINCRFGDPETQVVLPLLQSSLLDLLLAAASDNGELGKMKLQWSRQRAVGLVLAAPGYGSLEGPKTGQRITGLKEAEDMGALLFHAGIKEGTNGELLTSSGRVVTVVGLDSTRSTARKLAYAAGEMIQFAGGKQFRTDIGA